MSEMIERVAEAIERAIEQPLDGRHTMTFSTPADLEDWRRARAIAAIEAMREPTEAMEDAGDKTQKLGTVPTIVVWKSMINAALSTPDNDKT